MDRIDQAFAEIGCPCNGDWAEASATRHFRRSRRAFVRASALKGTIGFDPRLAAYADSGAPALGSQEVSMQEFAREPDGPIGPDDLDMLQRTFDRVCIWCDIPRYGKRADRLASHITGQFRRGIADERVLFENAMWLEQQGGSTRHRADN
ncbi:hypothetical protein [Ensifer adhaerens]|uniref:hypothetical protein n=1 Tax=Ensifer adhaerens TaxID=106592 RepID=UPI001C4E08A8|nr:hypothetical protein [Ensifer adhaerens]MBW0366888.1 hypothetical protein [Ensifer adhaerens]UCM21850.1 hypothetical protein LDL63_09855 [Ensifer adhaerens]